MLSLYAASLLAVFGQNTTGLATQQAVRQKLQKDWRAFDPIAVARARPGCRLAASACAAVDVGLAGHAAGPDHNTRADRARAARDEPAQLGPTTD